jgi:hypothetical protein
MNPSGTTLVERCRPAELVPQRMNEAIVLDVSGVQWASSTAVVKATLLRRPGVFPILGMNWRPHEDEGHRVLAERLAGWQQQYPEVQVQWRLICDQPARWLCVESHHAQLVIVGSHGRGGFAGARLGEFRCRQFRVGARHRGPRHLIVREDHRKRRTTHDGPWREWASELHGSVAMTTLTSNAPRPAIGVQR